MQNVTRKAPGRPKLYATNADRLRAFRARIRQEVDGYRATLTAWRSARYDVYDSEWEQAFAMIETYLATMDHPAAKLIIDGMDSALYFAKDKYRTLRMKKDYPTRPLPPDNLIKYL